MNSALFLGFALDKNFEDALDKISSRFLSFYISKENSKKNDDLLKKIEFQGSFYLGKYLSDIENISNIEMLEANIYSVLKKIVPNYDYILSPLVIIATPLS